MIFRLFLLLFVLSATACAGSTTRKAAQVTVISTGSAVAAMHSAHQDLYREATARLIATLRAQDASVADYDIQVGPIDRAFEARSDALQSLSNSIYAAAALIDATRQDGDSASYIVMAANLLTAIESNLATLHEAGALPPLPIPREIDEIVFTLRLLAGEFHDAATHL